jgi:hypothetical protein
MLKWSPGAGTTRLLRIPRGEDVSDAFVTHAPNGDLEVFHTRGDCDPRFTADGYKLVF